MTFLSDMHILFFIFFSSALLFFLLPFASASEASDDLVWAISYEQVSDVH